MTKDRTTHTDAPVDLGAGWRTRSAAGSSEVVTMPSGTRVRAQKLTIEQIATSGLLAEQDKLSKFVDDKLIDRGRTANVRRAQQEAQAKALAEPGALGALAMAMDRLIPLVVVEPEVRLHFEDVGEVGAEQRTTRRIPDAERVDGVIYTDQIPFTDKVWLSEYALGELSATFRESPGSAVAGVEHGAGVPRKGKRSRRH